MSQETLGKYLGVSGRTVSYWETWRKLPDSGRIQEIRKVLDLTDVEIWRVTHRAARDVLPKERTGGSIWKQP